MISLEKIAATVGEDNEHPLARRVWHRLAMREWRADWAAAQAAGDYSQMDYLDGQYERIQGI